MTTQELIEKAKTEKLTEEETKQIFDGITTEFSELKDTNPQKYLELISELNSVISELTTSLKATL